jgi:hypothetical protein
MPNPSNEKTIDEIVEQIINLKNEHVRRSAEFEERMQGITKRLSELKHEEGKATEPNCD